MGVGVGAQCRALITTHGALLLWRHSSTVILWFRLHWIVIQCIVNATTFVRCGLSNHFWPLAISTFCNTQFFVMGKTFVCEQPYSCEKYKRKMFVEYIPKIMVHLHVIWASNVELLKMLDYKPWWIVKSCRFHQIELTKLSDKFSSKLS